ncbi:MAG: helix-turn-helix domain-containing protein [Patescibacteria group bacterium]
MIEDKLVEIGLTSGESKVYAELLRIGNQGVSVIAKRAKLNRTTTYSILKSLEKKGLVSSCKNGGISFFTANDPNCLVGYVDSQCRVFSYYRDEILSLIPKFRELKGFYDFKKPIVSYHDGIEGVKYVMYDALSAKSGFCAYLCLHKWLKAGFKDFLINYKNFRIASKKIPLRAIVPDAKEVHKFLAENYKNSPADMTNILYVDASDCFGLFDHQMNIYDDKVAIIHLDKGAEYGVLIQDQKIADMQRIIFDVVWNKYGGV